MTESGVASTGSNIPSPLKWSISAAAAEFGLTRMTLRKLLAAVGARPDGGACYTTGQITEAIYGSLHVEKVAIARETRRKLFLENEASEGSLVNKVVLMEMFAGIADSMCSRIRSSGLSRDEQSDLLRELSSVPVAINAIATAQSRLPPNRRHGGDEDVDQDEGNEGDEGFPTRKAKKAVKKRFRRKPGLRKSPVGRV